MNDQLQAIINTPAPKFHANIRHQTRKEWAQAVRSLFKEIGIKGVSVTAPNYSQAQTIDIRLPELIVDNEQHQKLHDELWHTDRNNTDCPDCSQRWQAKQAIEKIILSAFPDLDNRSDNQSDYFNYCLSFN